MYYDDSLKYKTQQGKGERVILSEWKSYTPVILVSLGLPIFLKD